MSADNLSTVSRVPPELEGPLPRPVRLSGIGITNCVLALACIVFGVGLSARVVNDEIRRDAANESLAQRLTDEGRETAATVTGLRTGMGHIVSYEYIVDNHRYEKNAFIASELWHSLQVGSSLSIRYLPSDSTKSYPDTVSPNSQNHWSIVLAMTGMILLFMLSFAATQLSLVWPQRQLLAYGSPVRGVVTRCKINQGRRGGYVLHYDFPLADGSQCQGRGFSESPSAEDSTVTVLYDSNRPRRNALYPVEMAKLTNT